MNVEYNLIYEKDKAVIKIQDNNVYIQEDAGYINYNTVENIEELKIYDSQFQYMIKCEIHHDNYKFITEFKKEKDAIEYSEKNSSYCVHRKMSSINGKAKNTFMVQEKIDDIIEHKTMFFGKPCHIIIDGVIK